MKQVIENRTPLQRLLWLGAMAKASGGKLSEFSASGNPCVFETDVARPLKRLALSLLPRQSGTGDPSPSNIRPLLPWGNVGTWHFPENQLTINRVSSQTSSGITFTPVKDSNNKTIAIHVEGENTGNNTFFNLNYPNPGQSQLSFPPGSYVIKGATENIAFWGYYTDENDMTYQMINFSDGTFTVPENAVRSWVRLQVANGAVVNETIYPIVVKAGESITPHPVNVGNITPPVYGASVDLTTGEVWADRVTEQFLWQDGASATNLGDFTRKKFSLANVPVDVADIQTPDICNIAPQNTQYSGNFLHFYVNKGNKCAFVFLANDTANDTVIQVCYHLETPVLLATLTAQQVNALVGVNTVWSDADNVDVTYLKKG